MQACRVGLGRAARQSGLPGQPGRAAHSAGPPGCPRFPSAHRIAACTVHLRDALGSCASPGQNDVGLVEHDTQTYMMTRTCTWAMQPTALRTLRLTRSASGRGWITAARSGSGRSIKSIPVDVVIAKKGIVLPLSTTDDRGHMHSVIIK